MREREMLDQVRKRLSRLCDNVEDTLRRVPGVGDLMPGGYPPVDVYETPDAVIVRARVPGVSREELEVRVKPRAVVIRGRATPEKYETYTPLSEESPKGKFCREVLLPRQIDDEAEGTAFLENGVLTVRLKKAPPREGRTVNVEMR